MLGVTVFQPSAGGYTRYLFSNFLQHPELETLSVQDTPWYPKLFVTTSKHHLDHLDEDLHPTHFFTSSTWHSY